MRGLALKDPEITHTIGLVTPNTQLIQPVVRALQEGLTTIDVDKELD
jgi:hypothetical protein